MRPTYYECEKCKERLLSDEITTVDDELICWNCLGDIVWKNLLNRIEKEK